MKLMNMSLLMIEDLGDGMDNSDQEDEVLQEGESLSGHGDKGKEDYWSKLMNFQKNLEFIPTMVSETGIEVVIFDEELVQKGSEKWCLTFCGQFVGFEIHINEVRYNLRRMWGFILSVKDGRTQPVSTLRKQSRWDCTLDSTKVYGIDEIDKGRNGQYLLKFKDVEGMNNVIDKGPWMVKNKPLFVQKWSPEIGSLLGKPIVMDSMTASMCHKGIENLSYARVLVEMGVIKELKNEIEIQYVDKSKNVKGSNKVPVMYDSKPCLKRVNRPGNSFNVQNQNQVNGPWKMDKKKEYETKNQWKSKEEDNEQEIGVLKGRMIDENKSKESNSGDGVYDTEDVLEINNGTTKVMADNVIDGDMNVTLMPNEHSCGISVMTSDMAGIMTGILKKLDRVMTNEEFIEQYSNAHAKFLPYIISDLTPSILSIPTSIKKKVKAFRFSNYLTEKQEFLHIVKDK
ncbi:RNA-directed DNA polymerase, eukaryota, reverse transcriptase zinc-binding domain protein [Tanacetum coccineum]